MFNLASDDMNGTDSRPTRDVKYVQSFLGSTLLASWGNRGNVAQYNREWRECLRSDAWLAQTTGDFPFTSKLPLKLRYRCLTVTSAFTGHCTILSAILSDRVTTKTTQLDGYSMYRSPGMWLPAREALSHKLNHQQTVSDVEGGDEEEEMD